MPRPAPIAVSMLAACLYALWPVAAPASEEYAFHHENVMGTSLELRVNAGSRDLAARAEARALAEVDRLAAVLSGYDPGSEFSRWRAAPAGPVRVSPELLDVLRAADRWRAATGGAFDPRAGALARAWGRAAGLGREPTAAEVAAARARMAGDAWRLDPAAGTAERLGGCPLTLDGVAKGYIVGRACAAAVDAAGGVTGALLNVGGDMRACGDMARAVGVADPRHDSEGSAPLTSITVRDRAVATSGGSQRGFRVGGRRYSHIFDPRTGRPAERTIAATVVAPDSADADALATAFNVLTAAESLAVAKSVPGVECLLVGADGRETRSDGWASYEKSPQPPTALAAADPAPKGGTWDDGFEMAVKFELNNTSGAGRGFRRQYVAIWVEDRQGFPVRTLTLWGRGRWVTDLKLWYRGDQARKLVDPTDLRETTSRPTRPPGKYEVVWDGKDDHGKTLDRGVYTVFIEAAREHGTYQNIRKQVDLAGKPFAEELKGNVEIKSASIEYRRKGQGK